MLLPDQETMNMTVLNLQTMIKININKTQVHLSVVIFLTQMLVRNMILIKICVENGKRNLLINKRFKSITIVRRCVINGKRMLILIRVPYGMMGIDQANQSAAASTLIYAVMHLVLTELTHILNAMRFQK